MDQISTSPLPVKEAEIVDETHLTFPEAMAAIIKGKRITKLEWENPAVFGFLNGEFLSLHKEDGKNYKWIINDGDMNGKDWIILEDY